MFKGIVCSWPLLGATLSPCGGGGGYGVQLGASVARQTGAAEMASPPLLGPVNKEKDDLFLLGQ